MSFNHVFCRSYQAEVIRHAFSSFPEIFVSRPSPMMIFRSGQVWSSVSSQVLLNFLCYIGYSFWGINMKLSVYHKSRSTYKTKISEFGFRLHKVLTNLWPTHFKAVLVENLTLANTHQIRLVFPECLYIRLLLITQAQILIGDFHEVHLESPEVTSIFFAKNQLLKDLKTWAWPHCVFVATAHWLICAITHLGHQVTFA